MALPPAALDRQLQHRRSIDVQVYALGRGFACSQPAAEPSFRLDRCHDLRAEGTVVKMFYPRWHRKSLDAQPSRSLSD